jgi:hypothetical protein
VATTYTRLRAARLEVTGAVRRRQEPPHE